MKIPVTTVKPGKRRAICMAFMARGSSSSKAVPCLFFLAMTSLLWQEIHPVHSALALITVQQWSGCWVQHAIGPDAKGRG